MMIPISFCGELWQWNEIRIRAWVKEKDAVGW